MRPYRLPERDSRRSSVLLLPSFPIARMPQGEVDRDLAQSIDICSRYTYLLWGLSSDTSTKHRSTFGVHPIVGQATERNCRQKFEVSKASFPIYVFIFIAKLAPGPPDFALPVEI